MLSKNNFSEKLRKMEQKTERFSIRKLSIGAASVLIGLSFLGFNSHTAKADTASNNETTNKEENVTTANQVVKESNATASGLKFTDSAQKANETKVVEPKTSENNSANVTKTEAVTAQASAKAETETKNLTTKELAEENVAKNSVTDKNVTSSQGEIVTNNLSSGEKIEYGVKIPAPTEPYAKQVWSVFDKVIKHLSNDELESMGLDKDTFFESATDHTKWRIIAYAYLHVIPGFEEPGKPDVIQLGQFDYHNPDGTIAVNNETWSKMMDALINDPDLTNIDYSNYIISYKGTLVPIITSTNTIYVNKGAQLTFNDIKRALRNTENEQYLTSGSWVTNEAAAGIKEVDINKVGLQQGAVRLDFKNHTKLSASVNVDVVDLQGKTTYVNVNSPVPDAEKVITGQPANSKEIRWISAPDLNKVGASTGVVQVTYPDGSTGTAKVTFNVEDPKGKNITIHIGQNVNPKDVLVPNTYPEGSTITWVTRPNTDMGGTQNVSVIVTYPNGTSSHEIPAVITVVAPEGKDITTPNGKVPEAKTAISNVPEMPEGTIYNWKTTPEVKTPGTKPAVVVVTFSDGKSVDVPVKVTVEDPIPTGKDITTPNGKVPEAKTAIGNVPDMPAGTTYNWKTTPEVKTPGTKPAVVVVTFPDGKSVDVPVKVTVEDPIPTGKDITTPNGKVPEAKTAIGNVPDMPEGTTYNWKTTPEVKTPGTKPAIVVVTFPDGKSVEVPVNVTVEDPIPEGKDITTPTGQVPSAKEGISNVPEMPEGTTYNWKTTPEVKTPGTKPAVVVVTFPDGKTVDVPITVTVTESVPQPHVTTPEPEGKDIVTPYGKVPSAEEGIGNVPEMPEGTKYTWKEVPDVKTPGTKPAVVVVTFPDGKTVEVPVKVTVEDPIPEGKDITTPNGKVPEAKTAIGNVPEMPEGTKYTWKEVPDVKTPGTKPAVVVVTFPDGKTVEVPVHVTVDNPVPEGKDITTPNGKVPDSKTAIGNVPEMPEGTKYTWKEVPDVKTPGTKPAVVVVTFPDGKTVEVPVHVTVEDPVPEGKDINTPTGTLPNPQEGISNVPEMPEGTKYTWKEVPDVKTPGTKPAVVVVTFPDGKTVEVPVKVTVTESVPQPHVTTPEPEGQPITTDQGVVPSPADGIANKSELPNGTKYTWTNGTPDVTTPGTRPVSITVTYPDGHTEVVNTTITVRVPNVKNSGNSGNNTNNSNGNTGNNNHEATTVKNNSNVAHTSFYTPMQNNKTKVNSKTLPQTGAEANMAGLLGLMIASVGAILGLAADKKRKN